MREREERMRGKVGKSEGGRERLRGKVGESEGGWRGQGWGRQRGVCKGEKSGM